MQCSCNCEVDLDERDSPEICNTVMRTARKIHKCDECRREIKPSEKYESCRGKWKGDFETYKTCADCLSLRNQFFSCGWGFGDIWSNFRDTIGEWNYEVPEDCIVELTQKAREKVCQEIEDGWEYLDDLYTRVNRITPLLFLRR